MKRFEFATAGRIIFGCGTIKEIGRIAAEYGSPVLLISGKQQDRTEPVRNSLRDQSLEFVSFQVSGEPDIGTVRNGVAVARQHNCQAVVGFGGGSAIDAAKAIAVLARADEDVMAYLEVIGGGKVLSGPGILCLAIPTTAGTGSEVTRNAVLNSPEHRVKVSLRSAHMLPRVAIVDPELTLSLPPVITAHTGLDALTQLIEAFVCIRSNPMTDALCREGISRAARSLRVVFRDGQNREARSDMSLAALFGGLALANAGLGAVHGFAGPLGGTFGGPHGAICAALLPHVMDTNLRALRNRAAENEAIERYQEVARLLTGNPNAAVDDGFKWVTDVVRELRIQPLRTYGMGPPEIPAVIASAAQASSMKANPIALTPEELREILERAL